MLDIKHKNIGATVALLKGMSKLFPKPSKEGIIDKICRVLNYKMKRPTLQQTEESLAELFMIESNSCDHKVEGSCVFEVYPEPCISPPKCMIANCPLCDIVNEED